jgi:chlorite dismutase
MVGGDAGPWRITKNAPYRGGGLAPAQRLNIVEGQWVQGGELGAGAAWSVRSFTSNTRYVTTEERVQLINTKLGLSRPEASRAALIPITKSAAWWDLPQDQRRGIMEETSRHISIGLEYTPVIARRLLHCRDLGEPFDFLTWFEYAPEHAGSFEQLVDRLRATPEWTYVEREVDLRLERAV